MTEPQGPEDGFDLEELAGYLEEIEVAVDAHVTEARLLGLRTQALRAIAPALDCPVRDDLIIPGSGTDGDRAAVATPAPPIHPTAANHLNQTPGDSGFGRPWPLPVPPVPVPPMPLPLPSPLPVPPLPTEPVPAPPSSTSTSTSTPTWREPEDGGRDAGSRGPTKRQR